MLEQLAQLSWGPWTLVFFLATGLYFSVQSGFFQLFGIRTWMGAVLRGLRQPSGDGLSPLRTLSTALAAAIGTGSIAGVAAAITLGGPGAVFWMELSALLGMMTGCAEKLLSVHLRDRRGEGWRGGPMVWLKRAGFPGLSNAFALSAVVCSLGMGALVQSNSIASGLHAAFGWPPLAIGLVTAALAGLCLRKGLQSAGAVCEGLVPVMAGVFLISAGAILFLRRAVLPGVIGEIFRSAFTWQAGLGGGAGAAIRWGVARGLFTNEAGLGTTAMIHANSAARDPALEGMRGIFEVFVSTILVCTMSALVILTTVYPNPSLNGAALSAAAFRYALGNGGPAILSLCLTLFAFSSILGSHTYGTLGMEHLGLHRLAKWYLPLYLLAVVLGAVVDVTQVWYLADFSSALMAWPSLTALWIYRKEIMGVFNKFRDSL